MPKEFDKLPNKAPAPEDVLASDYHLSVDPKLLKVAEAREAIEKLRTIVGLNKSQIEHLHTTNINRSRQLDAEQRSHAAMASEISNLKAKRDELQHTIHELEAQNEDMAAHSIKMGELLEREREKAIAARTASNDLIEALARGLK